MSDCTVPSGHQPQDGDQEPSTGNLSMNHESQDTLKSVSEVVDEEAERGKWSEAALKQAWEKFERELEFDEAFEQAWEEYKREREFDEALEQAWEEFMREQEFDEALEQAWEEFMREREFDEALEKAWEDFENEREFDEALEQAWEEVEADMLWRQILGDQAEGPEGPEPSSLPFRCTNCGPTVTPTLVLKPHPDMIGFRHVPKKAGEPYCLDCSELIARRRVLTLAKSSSLAPEVERTRTIKHLLYRSIPSEKMLVADHFKFCRCCLEPTALVETPGDPCDDCRELVRCSSCCRLRILMYHHQGRLLCLSCIHGNRDLARSEGGTRVGQSVGSLENSACHQCAKLTRPSRRYCPDCSDHLKSLPGPKCGRCKLQPKSQGFKWCNNCRLRARYKWRLTSICRSSLSPPSRAS